MKFEITNPNYSRKVLEEAAAEVIKHQDSTKKDTNLKNDKKNSTLSVEKSK